MNRWIYTVENMSKRVPVEQSFPQSIDDAENSNPEETVPDNSSSSISEEYIHEQGYTGIGPILNLLLNHPLGHDKLPSHFISLYSPPPDRKF